MYKSYRHVENIDSQHIEMGSPISFFKIRGNMPFSSDTCIHPIQFTSHQRTVILNDITMYLLKCKRGTGTPFVQ